MTISNIIKRRFLKNNMGRAKNFTIWWNKIEAKINEVISKIFPRLQKLYPMLKEIQLKDVEGDSGTQRGIVKVLFLTNDKDDNEVFTGEVPERFFTGEAELGIDIRAEHGLNISMKNMSLEDKIFIRVGYDLIEHIEVHCGHLRRE